MLEVKIKLLRPTSKTPKRAHVDDAAWDVFADEIEETSEFLKIKTGVAIEPPVGYSFLAFPRSSISKKGWMLANSVGVIDHSYRGEIEFRFIRVRKEAEAFALGERIGQLKLVRDYDLAFVVSGNLQTSERGDGGFGSSGIS